jgi:hypothetical protein
MAVMAVEEGQSRYLGGGRDPGDSQNPPQKDPGRLRGAGLVALNPQPNCEGAGALPSGQSRHPTVIHATAPGEIGCDRGGRS